MMLTRNPVERVQVADQIVRGTEGPGDTHTDGDRHRDHGANAHEEQQDHEQDSAHAPHAHVGEVVLDPQVGLDARQQIAGQSHLDRRLEALRTHTVDCRLDQPLQVLGAFDVAAADRREHAHHDLMELGVEVVAVRVGLVRRCLGLRRTGVDLLLDRGSGDRRRGLVFLQQCAQGAADLVVVAIPDQLMHLLNEIERRVEQLVFLQEILAGADARVHPADQRSVELQELRHQRVERSA